MTPFITKTLLQIIAQPQAFFALSYLIRAVDSQRHLDIMVFVLRGVAQVARVLAWGARGRWFKSSHSDHDRALGTSAFWGF